MTTGEIRELLDERGWSRTQLAAALDVTENTIHQWCSGRRTPGGPASILMKIWLNESRAAKAKNGRARKEPAGAA